MGSDVNPTAETGQPARQGREWVVGGRVFTVPAAALPDHSRLMSDVRAKTVFAEKQQRLLTEALYASWAGPGEGRNFMAFANVGLFSHYKQPPLVPDVMLGLDVPADWDMHDEDGRSYFVWVVRHPPSVVIELVSDRRGEETSTKMTEYAQIWVPYYVVFDRDDRLRGEILQGWHLQGGRYVPLPSEPHLWFEAVGLGLRLWEGTYEGQTNRWLRWCDRDGTIIPTGKERADLERRRAAEAQEAADLAQREAEQVRQQRDQARQEVEKAQKEAEKARQRQARLEAQLRALGIDPADVDTTGP